MVLSKKKSKRLQYSKAYKNSIQAGVKKKKNPNFIFLSISQINMYIFFGLVQELFLLSDSLFIIMAINLLSVVGR